MGAPVTDDALADLWRRACDAYRAGEPLAVDPLDVLDLIARVLSAEQEEVTT